MKSIIEQTQNRVHVVMCTEQGCRHAGVASASMCVVGVGLHFMVACTDCIHCSCEQRGSNTRPCSQVVVGHKVGCEGHNWPVYAVVPPVQQVFNVTARHAN